MRHVSQPVTAVSARLTNPGEFILKRSGALLDFQQLCDDAFQSMRGKYFRPADLIAEMRLRKRLRIKMRMPRKSGTRTG
jgi:hypothetical protein